MITVQIGLNHWLAELHEGCPLPPVPPGCGWRIRRLPRTFFADDGRLAILVATPIDDLLPDCSEPAMR